MKLRSGKSYPATTTKKVMKITKKVRVKKMPDQLKAQVASLVKSAIARDSENKLVGWMPEPGVYHNGGITAADCTPILGQINPGTSAQQRIGDRLKPKRLTVKGVVSLTGDAFSSTTPFYVRLIIASQKDIKVGGQIAAGIVDTSHLLRPGFDGAAGSDQVPFKGNTMELNFPMNTDKFRVYMDKIVKLVPCSTPLTSPGVPLCPVPNWTARFSYTFKQLPAALTYDDGNGNWANNFAPFFACGYAYCDGNAPDTVTTRVTTNVYSALSFEDA